MPELPDVQLYIAALEKFIGGQSIDGIQIKSPFVLRTFEPDISECNGQKVNGFERLGKRIVWKLSNGLCMIFHLMIAGRFHWKPKVMLPKSKTDLAAFRFGDQTLMLTEASQNKRASLHVVGSESELESHRPPGIEVLEMTYEEFARQLTERNHTLKRSLTDPKLFSGIGNAYSDEILHAAELSPIKWTSRLTESETRRLFLAIQDTLRHWCTFLIESTGDRFPEKVTAFRPEMAVHGKFGIPCPACETKIQRIRYANNETNYCPRCQTDGKLLADRSLSRLLKADWPATIEELEEL